MDDDAAASGPVGHIMSPRAATITGVLLGLLLAGLVAVAFALTRSDDLRSSDTTAPEPAVEVDEHDHDHVEDDPAVEPPPVEATSDDPCAAAPEMCSDTTEQLPGGCDDPGMCGEITPGAATTEIDASGGDGPCEGELCGDIGPGIDDGTGA